MANGKNSGGGRRPRRWSLLFAYLASSCAGESPSPEPSSDRSLLLHAATEESLMQFRLENRLADLLRGIKGDLGKVERLTTWVHSQWEHDGSARPSKSDPSTILAEVRQGRRFRCVEYAIVLVGAAQAMGYPARVLGLKRRDVETAEVGAGHVVAEVWLPDQKSWVMADGQFDAVARSRGTGLNAWEVKQAFDMDSRPPEFLLCPDDRRTDAAYAQYLRPYLFYLDFAWNQRVFDNVVKDSTKAAEKLMLTPAGAPHPKVFQRRYPMNGMEYTEDPRRFYAPPL